MSRPLTLGRKLDLRAGRQLHGDRTGLGAFGDGRRAGPMALGVQVERLQTRQGGQGLAIAGIAVGAVSLVVSMIFAVTLF